MTNTNTTETYGKAVKEGVRHAPKAIHILNVTEDGICYPICMSEAAGLANESLTKSDVTCQRCLSMR